MLISERAKNKIGLQVTSYNPIFLFKNPHIATMYPYGFRKLALPEFKRERRYTIDGDFYDIDWIKNQNNPAKVAILLHGLEGSSSSQYIKGLTTRLLQEDIDVCAVNHRSCSGEMNKTLGFYHSGFTDDIQILIKDLSKKYQNIYIAGYSLGGNMALKYAGTSTDIPIELKAIITFSVPCHLSSSAVMLNHRKNFAYAKQFLSTLNKKIINKSRAMPELLTEKDFYGIKSLREYDEKVTAPLHSFENAEDYYEKSSSKQFLQNINVPTLLVNAKDDPFLAPPCFPIELAEAHPFFHFLATQYGGHVGYPSMRHHDYWSDNLAVEWFKANGL
jgi:uncharacterized protein